MVSADTTTDASLNDRSDEEMLPYTSDGIATVEPDRVYATHPTPNLQWTKQAASGSTRAACGCRSACCSARSPLTSRSSRGRVAAPPKAVRADEASSVRDRT
jgi:hypothetical protein